MPGCDPAAIHLTVCVTNAQGAAVYYAGLAVDQGLPQTGSKVVSGQILGRLGHAYPRLGPNLSLQGSNRRGTNRLLGLLKSPYPPLPVQTPKSRGDNVTRAKLLRDLEVFWAALTTYYPGLYDLTPRADLEQALADFRNTIPAAGLSVGEFANRLRGFLRFFSDNHMAVWESENPIDSVFLPLEIGAIGGQLFVLSSPVKRLPPGAQIESMDGTPAQTIVEALWCQGGRSDGTLGAWEQESLSRSAGSLWARTSGRRAGDKVKIVLSGGATTEVTLSKQPFPGQTDWWTRTQTLSKARGSPIPGWEDTPNITLRRISPDLDAMTLNSFVWSEVEKETLDRYFAERSRTEGAKLILDLRNNPGGEEGNEWGFLGYFNRQEIEPFVFRSVLNKKLSAVEGVGNLMNNDESTFQGFVPNPDGTYHAIPRAEDTIPVRENGRFDGCLIVLSNGMTGSAAFDAARILKTSGRAVLVGRPGPHGTNRMVAEKFAQVSLPETGVNGQIPMVKIVTEPGGEQGRAKPLQMDYPVELCLDSVLQKRDPEWEVALEIAGLKK